MPVRTECRLRLQTTSSGSKLQLERGLWAGDPALRSRIPGVSTYGGVQETSGLWESVVETLCGGCQLYTMFWHSTTVARLSPTERRSGHLRRASFGRQTVAGLATHWNVDNRTASGQSPAATRRPAGNSWKLKRQSHLSAHTSHVYSYRRAPGWRPPGYKLRSRRPVPESSVSLPRGEAAGAALASLRASTANSGPKQPCGHEEPWRTRRRGSASPRGLMDYPRPPLSPRRTPPFRGQFGRHTSWQSNGAGSAGTNCMEAPRQQHRHWTRTPEAETTGSPARCRTGRPSGYTLACRRRRAVF